MNRTTRATARALAAARPAGLEAGTTRPQLTEAEEAWTQTVINVELSLKAAGANVKGFLEACIRADRPTTPWWWEQPA